MENLQIQSPQSASTPTSKFASPDQSSNPTPTESSEHASLPIESEEAGSSSRQKSDVWLHFEKITLNGVVKARCLHCRKLYSAVSTNGTSHLRDHLNKRCVKKNFKGDVRQQLLRFNDKTMSAGSRLENYNFEQEKSRKDLMDMVIMHEYPLSMMDHFFFKRFVTGLNPNFKMISRNTLKADILRTFSSGKDSIKKIFEKHNGRIAITTDMWTANHQSKGYMVITSHYIDDNWVLHNKTLRFVFVPSPHTKDVLAQVLMDCFNMYNIAEKISVVVVDNCKTNDSMIELLRNRLDPESLILDGMFLHMRCSAHILNLVVQYGLDVIRDSIGKIRNCVVFWSASPKRLEKFEDKVRAMKLDCSRKLEMDCKTRWNSTFVMLRSALPYKDVFAKLKVQNPSIKFKFDLPTEEEWKFAALVCSKLEIFYDVTLLFSGRHFPTANLFFKHVCEIKLDLESWISSIDEPEVITKMSKSMLAKFNDYWACINGVLAVATVLDPRNKLACVNFYFKEIYGNAADLEIERIRLLLYDLLSQYQERDSSSDGGDSVVSTKRQASGDHSSNSTVTTRVTRWDVASCTTVRKNVISATAELDLYLSEAPLPPSNDFDVLHYWRMDLKYPTLRRIAKDILAIPASTVASESAFSAAGRLVTAHRSKLNHETVEALSCVQNWMNDEFAGLKIDNPQSFGTCTDDEEDTASSVEVVNDTLLH